MPSRRSFLMTAAAAPAAFGAGSRSYAEIEKLIARGDVKGRLTRDDVPTPALLLDLDLFEANVKKMFDHVKGSGRAIRPHGKTHKCPEIAKYLARQGASGNCVAKLSEAEVFARDGVSNLLITTAVVGRHKIERAVRLAQRRPETMFVIDNAQNASDLNDAARAARIKLNVAIDLLVGGRTGIQTGAPAVALAESIAGLANLKLAGLQSYAGHASHTVGFDNRARVSRQAMEPAVATRREIEKKGLSVPLLTGGSTGTYNIDTEIDGITELQPGSFMFMDVDYNIIGGKGGSDRYTDFGNALTVWTTVVSKPSDNVAIVDGGFKAFATDRKFGPEPKSLAGATYAFAGDEHGRLTLRESAALKVGDRVEFINPHCDPTVNLYDHLFCLRGDNVEAVWRIAARGMSQ
jgi:3-hydroxy-D-aspartate aldolase